MKTFNLLKRSLAMLLTLLMLLTSGLASVGAATVDIAEESASVDVAEIGAVNHTGGYVYFLKPDTWTESTVMMFIGHDSYTSVYTMTKVSNTDNLYRYTMSSWGGATYVAFANASSAWGSGSWGPSNRTNAPHYTNVYNNYGFNSGSYYVCVPANSSNNAGLTINYKSSASNLNLTTRANVYSSADGGASYSSNAAAGTVTVSGYYMSAYNTASARNAVSSSSSTAYASTTLAPGSTATFTATPAAGYEFVGWSTSSSESDIVSTAATYKYSYGISYTDKTVYALFKLKTYDVVFKDYDGDIISEQTVNHGSNPTTPANPTRPGYTFTGWSPTVGAITADTTYTATYTINSYTVTVPAVTGGTVSGAGDYSYGTEVTLTAEADSANSYAFTGWTLSGGYTLSSGYSLSSPVIKFTITGDVTATPSYLQTITYTVTAKANIANAGTVTPTSVEVAQGLSTTLSATANDGYRFDKWQISGSYTTNGNEKDPSLVITPEGDVTATAVFVKTYTVKFVDYDGSQIGEINTVDAGATASAPAAPTREHYVFNGWDTDFTNVQRDLVVTATYVGESYSVTVNATTGGSASSTASSVQYDGTVELTATPATGNVFTGWTISGDYQVVEGTLSDELLVVRPLDDITVQANFGIAQNLTVHSFSEDGNTDLTLKESNGTNEKIVLDGETQPNTTDFNGVEWKTSDTVLMTNGYSDSVIAILGGATGGSLNDTSTWYDEDSDKYLVVDEYITIICTNSKGWSPLNAYVWKDGTGTNNASWPGVEMTKVGKNDYGQDVYAIIIKDEGYNRVIFNNGSSQTVDLEFTAGSDIVAFYVGDESNGKFAGGTWEAKSFSTYESSGDIVLTSTLYKANGDWAGEEEVWIYQSGDTEIVTLRRDILNLIDTMSATYNNGTPLEDYTDDSWNAFVAAYESAIAVSGAGASEQSDIDDAKTALQAAYDALENQTYVSVSVSQTGAVGTVAVGGKSVSASTGTVQVDEGAEVTVTVTAPDGYYISSVTVNGTTVENQKTPYSTTATFSADSEISVTYAENPVVFATEYGATGGTITINGTSSPVSVEYLGSASVSVTAPAEYYISTIVVNGDREYSGTAENYLTHPFTIDNISVDTEIEITYIKRATYTITVNSYGNGGTLYYNDEPISSDGTVITVYEGETVVITATPVDKYHAIEYWVVDDSISGRDSTYTFANIIDNHEISIEWQELHNITISVEDTPDYAGTSTVSSGSLSSTDSITVLQRDTVILSAVIDDPCYRFVGWTFEGNFNFNEGTTAANQTINITPFSNIRAIANYELVNRKIYFKNYEVWSSVNYYIYDDNGDVGAAWPGTSMPYDSTLELHVAYVPLDYAGAVIFHDKNSSDDKRVEYTEEEFVNNNYFCNGDSKKAEIWAEPGYYLQGIWNGAKHDVYDLQKFTDNGDGTYSITISVTSTEDGYIYVNPSNNLSRFYEASTADNTDNPQILNLIGDEYVDTETRSKVKVEIDTEDFTKAYDVTFTFNPTTREFSWTKVVNIPTITITGTDGRGTNAADVNMSSSNDRVGNTYFGESNVITTAEGLYYQSAEVIANEPVTFYTQVNVNENTEAYDYYVAGWVVNGTSFVSATSLGNGLYSGSYVFTEDTDVVPVYFHTNEWLEKNSVKTATVYAIADTSIENWDKYMTAYLWYKLDGTVVYEQFGAYPGQLMIPVSGLTGVYYTIVETTRSDTIQISGITFNNYADSDDIDVVVNDYDNTQTYDYYEFISMLEDGCENITFVLKYTNDTYNSDRTEDNENITLEDYVFVPYTDYSGYNIDIFGNVITDIYDELSDEDAIYVVRTGNKVVSDGTLDGQFYVECYLYDAQGNYLGQCYSYELHDESSDVWTTVLANYVGQRAYISYEYVYDNRYDGEWYGDTDNTATVNLAVNVAVTTDGGVNYTVDTDGEVNNADYGMGYINVSYQNVDVTRGTIVTLNATPKSGYKFIGWYTADGVCFDTNTTTSVYAAIATIYTAVFEELKEGYFYVNHYIYQGVGTSDYIPTAHGGSAVLYVGIENSTKGTSAGFSVRESASIAVTEGDELIITIGTDAIGADKFYAWYVDAVDKYGLTTFEEVGVDTDDNIATTDPTSPYYNNGTVLGRNDLVYYRFKYTVGNSFSLSLYSDLIAMSDEITLIYQYEDRYGNPKSYYVKYELTDEEILGFAGNNNTPYSPAYISSTDGSWENTILANAPYVEDYYKDTTWTINSAMYDTLSFLLWATQPNSTYTVTSQIGDVVVVSQVEFNSTLEINALDYSDTASRTGFWYNDVNNNGVYDADVDIILTYGAFYGYRVTQDMSINYENCEEYDFSISLDAPVYGREQTTDADGENKTDRVLVDYIFNILTPYFYDGSNFEPYYNGEEITENWKGSQVTLESLERAGYEFEYGIILEHVGNFLVDGTTYSTFEDAEAAAQAKGYGTAADASELKTFVEGNAADNWTSTRTYLTKYRAASGVITSKNRVQYVIDFTNNDNFRKRFYNAYAYVMVTDPDGVTTTYISNVQTTNIYETGVADANVSNNTDFV